MNEADALEIMQAAIRTVLIASGPAVLAAMIVGVGIAFLQALTQIQEMTLTFVPKIVAILVTIAISAPFIGGQVYLFAELVFSRVQSGF
ncbi:flagellar biosynthesis protein FliQ [Rhizobiales bacterium RZME27]|jgi:flagellar biosynthetic protein FliQ|uniref:Flagellar biosynthetic protein FliQ n=1 Tax=Endobacterium cereale TaxID=2663029 RepID=A0A6A8AFS5_9HYPH|nr:flagellar biosynthesis protein FliQ [Endobacterium cereale]MEB2848436.1 flagellar biosynthesis protein FliQ [Endobacterium cereale]MQY48076.1 flagellar biosynthesis protein FliQ [Endobacterium cereale]